MKKYRVNVNGTDYEVTVEEITEEQAVQPEAAKSKAPAATSADNAEGNVITPMPGNILKVNVREGDSVKRGSLLMILEAMKMENEILAPLDGVVKRINVNAGDNVDTDALLCVIG